MRRQEKGMGDEAKNWVLQGNQGYENMRGKHTFKPVHIVMPSWVFRLGWVG